MSEFTNLSDVLRELTEDFTGTNDVTIPDYAAAVLEYIDESEIIVDTLEETIRRQAIIIDKELGETRLVRFGPGDDGWNLELRDGPISVIAQYLVEMLNMDTEDPLNFVSMEVNHHKHGRMELRLRRLSGKTDGELLSEARKDLAEAQAENSRLHEFIDAYEFNSLLGDYEANKD